MKKWLSQWIIWVWASTLLLELISHILNSWEVSKIKLSPFFLRSIICSLILLFSSLWMKLVIDYLRSNTWIQRRVIYLRLVWKSQRRRRWRLTYRVLKSRNQLSLTTTLWTLYSSTSFTHNTCCLNRSHTGSCKLLKNLPPVMSQFILSIHFGWSLLRQSSWLKHRAKEIFLHLVTIQLAYLGRMKILSRLEIGFFILCL